MTDNDILAEVQALHQMVKTNYRDDMQCFLVDSKGPDKGRMARLQILLSKAFESNKAGREKRLDTLVTILPLLEPNGDPIEFTTANVLWVAELSALIKWLSPAIDEIHKPAFKVLKTISMHPGKWAIDLRDAFGYIKRPVVVLGDHYASEEQREGQPALLDVPVTAHERQPFQGPLPF